MPDLYIIVSILGHCWNKARHRFIEGAPMGAAYTKQQAEQELDRIQKLEVPGAAYAKVKLYQSRVQRAVVSDLP